MERILVIDDHVEFGKYVGHLISNLYPDTHVYRASNGREGITMAYDKKPDLILVDLHMPFMDGYEVARALQSEPETQSIPLIAMTLAGNEQSQTLAELRPFCHAVLYKPFQVSHLESAIQRTGAQI
jgi:two-component system, OmpR family, alkaline phosphatase synthesis response regulator PhoP